MMIRNVIIGVLGLAFGCSSRVRMSAVAHGSSSPLRSPAFGEPASFKKALRSFHGTLNWPDST